MKELRKNNYSQFVIRNLARFGLSALLGIVLVGESVSAIPKSVGVEVAQQQGVTSTEAIRAEAKKLTDEGFELFKQGTAESLNQAIDKWEQALPLWRKVDDKGWEANILLGIGRVYSDLGEKQQALKYYNQALLLKRELTDKHGEAIILNNIGFIYDDLGNKQLALKYYNQALPIRREVEDKSGEAATLNNIGSNYSDLGDNQQALKFYNQALLIFRKLGDKNGEAITLNNIGSVYNDLGENRQALKYHSQALPLRRQFKDKRGLAATLGNIGKVYSNLGDKQQALKLYKQALPLSREAGDKSGEATTLSNIGGVYSDLGDKQLALKYYNQALILSREIEYKAQEATIINNIGNVYSDLGNKQQALKLYKQALSLSQEINDKNGEAITLNNIAGVYSHLGDKQQALKFYNQALTLSREVEDKTQQATTINNIGGIYDLLGDKQQALKLYNQSLLLRRKIEDKSGEAGSLNDIGSVYQELGDIQQALKYYNQALLLSREVQDKTQQATTLNNIGYAYSRLGDKQQALKYYNQALPLSREVEDKTQQSTTLNNIGTVYSDLGDKQRALDFLNQALLLSREVEYKFGEAKALNNIGAVYDNFGEKQQALKYYNQALPLKQEIEDKSGQATTLNNIGFVYFNLGNNQQALKHYNQSLPLAQEVGDKDGEAITLTNIGKVYNSLGDNQRALKFHNQALPLAREIRYKQREATILRDIARAYRKNGNLQQALTNIKAAVDIIENLRTKVDSNELRTSYFATVQDIYKLHIDILMQLHKQNPSLGYDAQALAASEKSRARGLLELLTEANADIRKGANPEFLAEEKRLQQLINSKEKLRLEIFSDKNKNNDPVSKAAAQRFKKQVQNHINELNQLQAKIKTTSPKYAQLKYPEPLNLPKIQQQLDKDTVLLQYSLGEKRSYLWKVTPDSLDSYELPKSEQIETAAKKFRNVLQGVSSQGTGETATELSKLILAPVANKIGKKRLVIVADGALQNIPFAALTDLNSPIARDVKSQVSAIAQDKQRGIEVSPNNPSPQKTSNYQPLIINHEIVNLPSASTIAIQRQETAKRTTSPASIAILADPVFTANDSRVTNKSSAQNGDYDSDINLSDLNRTLNDINLNTITRLKGTREEAKGILKLFAQNNNLQAFDFEANYNWAVNPKLDKYRFIHFATHGFANSVNPELSGIVLSMVDKQGNKQKGFLRMHEIFNLDFPADLVVLSACQTALGKQVKGEGIVGLTRSLMYAGAERVALSLWNVDDAATSNLMQSFYREMLQQGKSPATALREAQIKMWRTEKWRNPYAWAAFTIQGEWN
jgi:tetratricopeptide (TPR) repeat protein